MNNTNIFIVIHEALKNPLGDKQGAIIDAALDMGYVRKKNGNNVVWTQKGLIAFNNSLLPNHNTDNNPKPQKSWNINQ